MRNRFLFVVVLLTAIVALSACAGVHFYDATSDATAKEVKKAYQEAQLVEVIAIERANRAKLLEEELKAIARFIGAARDGEVLRIADSPKPFSQSFVEQGPVARRAKLGIARVPESKRPTLATWEARLRSAENELELNATSFLAQFHEAPPACLPGDGVPPEKIPGDLLQSIRQRPHRFGDDVARDQALIQVYGLYRQACLKTLRTLPEEVDPSGVVMEAYNEWVAARNTIEHLRRAAAQAQRDYEQAVKEYEAGAASDPAIEKSLAETIAKVRAGLEGLEQVGGALGVEIASKERIKEIDKVLETVASGKADAKAFEDPATRRAIGVVASLPSLADEAWALIRRSRAPHVSALLIEKEYCAARGSWR